MLQGMNDAAWYLSERGGRTGGAKGIFLAQYGYRAVVVNDYDALKALLMGNVNVNEVPGEMVDGVDTGLVSAWQVVSIGSMHWSMLGLDSRWITENVA